VARCRSSTSCAAAISYALEHTDGQVTKGSDAEQAQLAAAGAGGSGPAASTASRISALLRRAGIDIEAEEVPPWQRAEYLSELGSALSSQNGGAVPAKQGPGSDGAGRSRGGRLNALSTYGGVTMAHYADADRRRCVGSGASGSNAANYLTVA